MFRLRSEPLVRRQPNIPRPHGEAPPHTHSVRNAFANLFSAAESHDVTRLFTACLLHVTHTALASAFAAPFLLFRSNVFP